MAKRPSDALLERDFDRIVAAAHAGERCPQSSPHGPLHRDSIRLLIEAGRIRSEVYPYNFRVVTILNGEHRGRQTAPAPAGQRPYLVNGAPVDRLRHITTRIAP